MPITFRCQYCRKTVKAPDSAAGKRGKCPHCGQTSYVPSPISDGEVLELAPLDEQEERRRQEVIARLLEQERDLLFETGGPDSATPLEGRQDLTSEELHHFVVNYCLCMSGSKLPQARLEAQKLRKFGFLARQAVEDFLTGKAMEPALDAIPTRVLQGFLKQLQGELG